jgi:hypothetical protein
MIDLKQAIKLINEEKPSILYVDMKSYVRIKRDIEQSILMKPTPYSRCVDSFEKWAWHNLKAMKRQAKLMVMGTEVRMK